MKKKIAFLPAATALVLLFTHPVTAQYTTGISLGINTPLRGTADSVPGIRAGVSVALHPGYSIRRFNISSTIGYQTLNTGNGFEALARQNGYTTEKGFTANVKSGSLVNLALGASYNLLPRGNTTCGLPKLSLLLGVQGGYLITAGKIDEEMKTKAGETAFALQQTGKTATLYYRVSLELLYPVSNTIAFSTAAAWNRAVNELELQHNNNGNMGISHFTYSDLQVSIGVQIAFKGITEKGIKRSRAVATPVSDGDNSGGEGGEGSSGQPQARTTGQPIGGIVVKGGQNPGGSTPKPHNMVTGNPIPGVVVKGGRNPGANLTVFDHGASGKGIQEKGMFKVVEAGMESGGTAAGVNEHSVSLVYTDDFVVKDPTLLSYLGVDQLVIEKGAYAFDYSVHSEGRVLLHLHKEKIIHKDLAARSFVFEGTDPDGQPFTYTVEPVYVQGVAKDILVTYKGISEKGIK